MNVEPKGSDWDIQATEDAEHHLSVAHDVTHVGNDRALVSTMAKVARDALGTGHVTALADCGDFNAPESLACEQAGIIPLAPKPLTSNRKAEGRFDKRDFIYETATDEYESPARRHRASPSPTESLT